jgi:hypothetical protein
MPDSEETRSQLRQQALEYRNRAEEFRTVGEAARSVETRRILRDLADKADDMAATLERQLGGRALRC